MKWNGPLLSVIVSVYNTEKFLAKCLESIAAQTYKNLEVIVVNDGSAGDADAIILEYAARDSRFKLIKHQENEGLFQARITGMEAAGGEYFTFVDSDDSISVDYYRLMIKKAAETGAEIVVADLANEYEDGSRKYYNLDPLRLQDLELEGESVFEAFMKQQGLFFGWHTVWNKIYSADLWEKSKALLKEFAEEAGHLVMTEDIAFSCVFWSRAKKAVSAGGAYYFYTRHPEQSVAKMDIDKFEKNVRNVAAVFGFFESVLRCAAPGAYEKDYAEWKRLYIGYWCEYIGRLGEPHQKRAEDIVKSAFDITELALCAAEDNFFYRAETDFTARFAQCENLKKSIAGPQYKYISFDVFDTLITRPLSEPRDLYKFLNLEFNRLTNSAAYIDFAEIREKAEDTARATLLEGEDCDLDEIYGIIENNYHFDAGIAECMKRRETELELDFCGARPFGKTLYELAVYAGKTVIFISDMYLPEDVVKRILEKNGYSGALFLSSGARLLKRTGNLYKRALRELGAEPGEILHIGDNQKTDVEAARSAGIEAFHLPGPAELFKRADSYGKIFGAMEPDASFLGIRCMLGLAANKNFDCPFDVFNADSDFNADPYFIGYYALGMHLYAVARWLTENTADNGTVHFIARDGYLPRMAYEILARENSPKTGCQYFTRKSMLDLVCADLKDICSIEQTIVPGNITPERFLGFFGRVTRKGIDPVKLCEENNICRTKNFTSYLEYMRFIKIFRSEILDLNAANEYRDKFADLLSRTIGENDALFDLGYSGRNEYMLSKLLGRPVDALYIHTNKDICGFRGAAGGFKVKTFYDFRPAECVVIREHLFSALEPSCVGFDVGGGALEPIFEEYSSNYQTWFITRTIQNAALDFVRDMRAVFGEYENSIVYKNCCASAPYEFYLNKSAGFDRQVFGASEFEDDVHGGKNVNFVEFWNRNEKPETAEERAPVRYEDFLEGAPKWKKALFMLLFDRALFWENLKKRFPFLHYSV